MNYTNYHNTTFVEFLPYICRTEIANIIHMQNGLKLKKTINHKPSINIFLMGTKHQYSLKRNKYSMQIGKHSLRWNNLRWKKIFAEVDQIFT
jgi:hypothetical protein